MSNFFLHFCAGDRSLLVREPGLPAFLRHSQGETEGHSGRRRGQTVQGTQYKQ